MNDSGSIESQPPASLLRLKLDCGWREMRQGGKKGGERESEGKGRRGEVRENNTEGKGTPVM